MILLFASILHVVLREIRHGRRQAATIARFDDWGSPRCACGARAEFRCCMTDRCQDCYFEHEGVHE
jgi:hypothetical protein